MSFAFVPQSSPQAVTGRQLPRVPVQSHTGPGERPAGGHCGTRPHSAPRHGPFGRSLCHRSPDLPPPPCPHSPTPLCPHRLHAQTSPPRPQTSLPPFPFASVSKEAAPLPEKASPPAGAPEPSRLTARPSPRRLTPPTPDTPSRPASLPSGASRLSRPGRPLTAITTVSSPWNLAMYLSPRATSDSLRGLKRHITLMLHSAGSAILGHCRLRGAQFRRRQLPPSHHPRRGSRKPPWPGNPRPPRQEGKGKGSFLAAAAASRSHFLPNMAPAMAAAAAAPAPPRRWGGRVTSPTAAPAPPPPLPSAQARHRPRAGGAVPAGPPGALAGAGLPQAGGAAMAPLLSRRGCAHGTVNSEL